MDKYPVRNPYYKHQNGEPWFDELAFTIIKNYIYDAEFDDNGNLDILKRIEFKNEYNNQSVEYTKKYKFVYGDYKIDWSDIESEEKEEKSKWS